MAVPSGFGEEAEGAQGDRCSAEREDPGAAAERGVDVTVGTVEGPFGVEFCRPGRVLVFELLKSADRRHVGSFDANAESLRSRWCTATRDATTESTTRRKDSSFSRKATHSTRLDGHVVSTAEQLDGGGAPRQVFSRELRRQSHPLCGEALDCRSVRGAHDR